MKRTGALIVNYNMPERTDALVERIVKCCDQPVYICVIDNGSDLQPPSKYSTVKLPVNVQTTGGWLAGLEHLRSVPDIEYYWFLITSADIPNEEDVLTPMVEWLDAHPDAVGIHPALTEDSTTGWQHLITRGGDQPRRTWMIDNIASLYRKSWFDTIGWFDPKFTMAWGIDLETCFIARQQGKTLWVDERVKVRKITNIGYTMNRMNMAAEERSRKAGDEMRRVLFDKYGPLYWQMMTEANVTDEIK